MKKTSLFSILFAAAIGMMLVAIAQKDKPVHSVEHITPSSPAPSPAMPAAGEIDTRQTKENRRSRRAVKKIASFSQRLKLHFQNQSIRRVNFCQV